MCLYTNIPCIPVCFYSSLSLFFYCVVFSQRTPSFLTLPKLNMSRLSPTKNILQPLSRLSPRLKRKSNASIKSNASLQVENFASKAAKQKGNVSPGERTHSLDVDDSKPRNCQESTGDEDPDFNYSMNILLQQEDGRKNAHTRTNRIIKALSSIPRSYRKINKKLASSDDNISLASKISIESAEKMLAQVLESGELEDSVKLNDSFDLSSSSSSTTSTSSSSSSCTRTFDPIIYNYEPRTYEPVVDLSNIKYFPRRNSDFADQVNLILSEKYPGTSLEELNEKREREIRKLRVAEKKREEELERRLLEEEDEALYRGNVEEKSNYTTTNVGSTALGNNVGTFTPRNEATGANDDKGRVAAETNVERSDNLDSSTVDSSSNLGNSSKRGSAEGSPKTRKVSMFEGNLLEPNRDNGTTRRYSDASQLSPHGSSHGSPQPNMARRHSSSDIGDRKCFEGVYGRRLSDLPDLVTVKMAEKKPKKDQRQQPPDQNCRKANENNSVSASENKNVEVNEKTTCGVEIKVDDVSSENTAREETTNDVTQQITESFSFLDNRGTPPMSEMDRVDYGKEKKTNANTSTKAARPYLSTKNRVAYKETIFTPKMEMMLTVTEPSVDSSSSRQVSFDHDTSHDDLALESSKEEIEFTGSHFLDLKPKLSKSYENLSSLNDEDLSPERSFVNIADETKHNIDRSKKINLSESYPRAPVKTHFCDPLQVFGRPLEKLSEEGDSKSPSLSDEDADAKISLPEEDSKIPAMPGESAKIPSKPEGEACENDEATSLKVTPNDSIGSNPQHVQDNGDTNTNKNSKRVPNQTPTSQQSNTVPLGNSGSSRSGSNNQGSGGDDGDDHNRNSKPLPKDKLSDDYDEEEEENKTPPMSRMSPIVFGDEPSHTVNFLSYNVTKSGSLIGVDEFNAPSSPFQMSLMNINDVSRSNPNLSCDTKVRLTPRDKSRSMFDLVIVTEDDKKSGKRRRSSLKKSFRRRESKSAENLSKASSERKLAKKQTVLSDENLQNNAKSMENISKIESKTKSVEDVRETQINGKSVEDVRNLQNNKSLEDVSGPPPSSLVRKDSIFARRRISLTNNNDWNRRDSRSNGNSSESVENMASTLLTRRGSVNLKRTNSITKKNGDQIGKKGNKPIEERETYESVAGSVLMRRDSVKRLPEGRLRKQNSQSSESITPYTYRDPFGDHLIHRSCSVTSVSEYKETLRRLLKSQESIDEVNESDLNKDRKLESQSLVNITEQVEGDENVNKSESNIHKMIAVAKPTSILKNKIDFKPIPADKEIAQQKKDNNQNKARNFFGEDIDLVSIESDAKTKHESSPSNAPYSRIIANREDPLESRYSHIIANRVIVKPKQPAPDTKIQNGKDLHRRFPTTQQHLKSNDYLVQKDFNAPVRPQNIDYMNYREASVDSVILGDEGSVLRFTDFKNNDSVMKKLLSDSKKKAESEMNLVMGESILRDESLEDLIQHVTKFIDAEIKATLLQRCEEGQTPVAVVPSTESKLSKTQNFTAKFIETEREACATQRVEGHDKKKKSILIIKSTEPIFSTMENTFVISTEPRDDAILTTKMIQKEKEHSTALLRPKKSKTPEYVDSADPKSSSQKHTAEFIEKERLFSSLHEPHLVLCKKIGGRKSLPPPIGDILKKEANIKEELERTAKFLQMERLFCSLQEQTIVKNVRRSIDTFNLVNDALKEAIRLTQNFIENEKKFALIESTELDNRSSAQRDTGEAQYFSNKKRSTSQESSTRRGSSESKSSSHKKKSPSQEKEKRPSSKKKCVPTQEEIDMIIKRQSYDFALSKMNMTGVIPNINAYRIPESSKQKEMSNTPSRSDRSEPDYAYIISQSNLNQQGTDRMKLLKNNQFRMSGEEVLFEESVKDTSGDGSEKNFSVEKTSREKEQIDNETEKSSSRNKKIQENVPPQEIGTPSTEIHLSERQESPTDSAKTNIQESLDSNKILVTETLGDKQDICAYRLPCEDSTDQSESSIVNFFSASMETIKSRLTGHSDDFSDFVESVESGLAETCDAGDKIEDVRTKSLKEPLQDQNSDDVRQEKMPIKDQSFEKTEENSDQFQITSKSLEQTDVSETRDHESNQSESKEVVDSKPSVLKDEKDDLDCRDAFPESVQVTNEGGEPIQETEGPIQESNTNCTSREENVGITTEPTQENDEVINESIIHGNGDILDNLSPKSSASEILSDSTIDNQLNECRNCQHTKNTKIDSLDFLSDEELKCTTDLVKEESNLMDQLRNLEAEKRRVNSKESTDQDGSNMELFVETCQLGSEEQITLEHKTDDMSPDLVVTQETSATVDEVENITPVTSPRTKKKKKKKQHASKEDLSGTTEASKPKPKQAPKVSNTIEQVEVNVIAGKADSKESSEIEKPPLKTEDVPLCGDQVQAHADSQEESDCKSKSKKKRKRRTTLKTQKEELSTNSQVNVKEADGKEAVTIPKEKEHEGELENVDGATETKSHIASEANGKPVENKPNNKKKAKLSRHMTQAILDVMKSEGIKTEDQNETCNETADNVEEIPLKSHHLEDICDEKMEDQTDTCHETADDTNETPLESHHLEDICDETAEEYCKLDEVCEDYDVARLCLQRPTQAPNTEKLPDKLDEVCENNEDGDDVARLCLQRPPQAPNTEKLPDVSVQNTQSSSSSPASAEHRVDINTGLDVINSRLDIINLEISTIAHVLSNINNEIKHGSSTVALDVALDITERSKTLLQGALNENLGTFDSREHKIVLDMTEKGLKLAKADKDSGGHRDVSTSSDILKSFQSPSDIPKGSHLDKDKD